MDGIIIINKPKGISSNGVVQKVRKALNTKQAGHTGTLDPLATGVLPILAGKATKISKYLIEHDKTYNATLKLGRKTSTGDLEGDIIEEKGIGNINRENIENVLKSFLGTQLQVPPIYSAIKIDGKKLYEYAREGIEVEVEPRKITIYDINLIKWDKEENEIVFNVKCSKGTYIRVLCEDIAVRLGTAGFMKDLVRTSVDNFLIENSITIEDLEKNKFNLITIEEVFKDRASINLDERKLELFLNGVMLTNKSNPGVYRIYSKNKFIGLGTINRDLLKRDVII